MLSSVVKHLIMGDGAINEYSWSSGPFGNGGHLVNRNGILTICKKPSLQSKALKSISESKLQPKACSSLLLPHCVMNTEYFLAIEALYKVLWPLLFMMFENSRVYKALGFPFIVWSIKHIINCIHTHSHMESFHIQTHTEQNHILLFLLTCTHRHTHSLTPNKIYLL